MPKIELKIGGEYLVPVVVTNVKKTYVTCELAGSKGAMTVLFPHDITDGFRPASEAERNKKNRKSTEASPKREASGGHVVRVEETEHAFFVVTTGEHHRVLSTYFKHHGPHVAKVLARTTAEEINKLWND